AGVDVEARRDIEIILGNFVAVDYASKLFGLRPCIESRRYMHNSIIRNVILGIALCEFAASIKKEQLAFPLFRLCSVEHNDHAGCARIVEKIFREINYTLD